MRKILLSAALLMPLLGITSCRSLPPVVIENGPAVVRAGVSVGVRWALADQHVTKEEASRISGYVADAKAIIASGAAPVNALDDLAAYLNTKVTNEVVRSAIQYGIEMIKANITIPTTGVIGEKTKIWVYAVLDGAQDGCAAYIAGLAAPAAGAPRAPSQISFR